MSESKSRSSVVLVHGAWADGSSWNETIGPLLSKGLNVLAAPIPLTSLSDDIAALERALERTDGPVVLVAHAYAGAVIAASTNERTTEAEVSFQIRFMTFSCVSATVQANSHSTGSSSVTRITQRKEAL